MEDVAVMPDRHRPTGLYSNLPIMDNVALHPEAVVLHHPRVGDHTHLTDVDYHRK